jgi:DNA-binding CsgD family transcriptional regulator
LRRAEAVAPRRVAPADAAPSQLEQLGLTPREAEILLWVAQGKTNPEIATILGIGLTTVKKHLEATFAKLGVENRTTAAALALEKLGGA